MDKNGEQIFTSEFWREINEQYFIVQSPVQITDIDILKSKSRNGRSSKFVSPLNKVIRQNNRTKLFQTNLNNLKTRFQLLFMQRQSKQEPIENLIDEMIDEVCFDHLSTELMKAQELIKNITLCSDAQQLQIYNQEADLLSNLMQQIDWPDELSISIEQYQQQLDEITSCNRNALQILEQHIHQINLTLLYTYNSSQVGEHKLKLTRSRLSNHQNELSQLKHLIISQQDYQVAESIAKATFNDQNNTVHVIFDKYLSKTPITMSVEDFGNLQRFREQKFDLVTQPCNLRSDVILYVGQQDVFEMQMCHYCKEMVEIKNLKQCQYNHFQMGLHEYNEDLLICQRYQINAKQARQFLIDFYAENYVIENKQIMCQRYFCLKCLKYDFDSYETTSYLWICPLCKGFCTCERCERNDMIYKMKRQFLELNGDLEDIYRTSQFESLVKEKRRQLLDIPLEFLNNTKNDEETIYQKTNRRQNQSNQIRKKINKDDSHLIKKSQKLYQQESSSSSIKMKRSKETTTQNTISSLDSINSQMFI
ncbi:unnamed protein product (macronuclear) [Paramecium tetraurelia]|uniref:Zinc-finger domain-containing protein n=1 Tax=Paramecium tetraurelia TaxID=5888 RepID=A0EDZ4_PARTE|nr:uncharacterized protein GSPATT00025855001 [Paramecium tetraurelia]CAK93511.1 unnamed protein product [Paramecium tetraurelia]|eukprot:XP_001460908.1 hypothetical protein (macronuclear) [Paramecium tetraurelia strain d4-2]